MIVLPTIIISILSDYLAWQCKLFNGYLMGIYHGHCIHPAGQNFASTRQGSAEGLESTCLVPD